MSDTMRIMFTQAQMKQARKELGRPAALNEALVDTGIDALFVLLDGGRVSIDGKTWELREVSDGRCQGESGDA